MSQPKRNQTDKTSHNPLGNWWRASAWHRFWLVIIALVMLTVGSMYGIAQWYIAKHRREPLQLGVTFIPDYAQSFGLDPKETLNAVITDLGVKRVRLVSYWENGENMRGKYDFSFLDWQFDMAEKHGVKVSLAIGLRQPRWPECHLPAWADKIPKSQWQPELMKYIAAVVDRYKDRPSLDSYQLENEYFLSVFGLCTDFSRDRLVAEYNLVKSIDPHHTLVVSMSNNAIGTPIGQPTPDEWAISVYKRVWDKTITRRYFEYPIPAWYYAFRAGWVEITRGHNSFIHELQAEAWPAADVAIQDAPIVEQDKSLDAKRLKDRFSYGEATGMRTIDLWGVEWWYWRKVQLGDPSLWDVAKQEFAHANQNPLQ